MIAAARSAQLGRDLLFAVGGEDAELLAVRGVRDDERRRGLPCRLGFSRRVAVVIERRVIDTARV